MNGIFYFPKCSLETFVCNAKNPKCNDKLFIFIVNVLH